MRQAGGPKLWDFPKQLEMPTRIGGEPEQPAALAGAQPGEQDLHLAWVAVSLPIDHRGDVHVGATVAVEIRPHKRHAH